jgi:type VI secretion system protein ImpE
MSSARAQALYERGELDEAIEALNGEVRDNPLDSARRTFLFELLCFSGAWERAEKQLDVLARSGQEVEMGALLYRSALHASREREEMFRSGTYPQGDSGPPAVSGTVNGKRFESIEDLDPRLGARLEVFVAGQYTWLPLSQLAGIRAQPPVRLRDLLWIPAQIIPGPKFRGMELGEVLLPALSPGSHRHPSGPVRLGREARAEALDGQEPAMYGPKFLLADDEMIPFLGLREVLFDSESENA